jgi:hypothetical protein
MTVLTVKTCNDIPGIVQFAIIGLKMKIKKCNDVVKFEKYIEEG